MLQESRAFSKPRFSYPGTTANVTADAKNLQLCQAVVDDDVNQVRAALADGADINARVRLERFYEFAPLAYPGQPALGWAWTVPMVELLLDAGAAIDGTDEDGRTALYRAVLNSRSNRIGVIELLLRRGADPNVLAAVRGGGVQLVQMLLDTGAKITLTALNDASHDPELRTLLEEWPIRSSTASAPDKQLMLAARAGALETVTALLREGAGAIARDANGASAVDHALKQGHTDVAFALERATASGSAHAALWLAVLDDSAQRVREAAASADLEAPNEADLTALALAARYRRHAAARALIAAGAKIDQRALVAAIEAGDLEGMRLLFDLGGSVGPDPGPILRAACEQPDSDLLRQLLVNGIDLAPYPDLRTASTEADRLLRHARAGRLPPARPTAATWNDCPVCRDLLGSMGWCHSANGERTGEPLPEVTTQFETFGFAWRGLWKCPQCSTYYQYESDHDNGITDGWDSEYLIRVDREQAIATLRELPTEPRIERELAALTATITSTKR
jgi:hypothetical protein